MQISFEVCHWKKAIVINNSPYFQERFLFLKISGIRPYKCSYCSHASSLIHNCKAHIKQKHPGMEVKVVTLPIPDLVVEPEEHLEGAADEGSDGHDHEDDQGIRKLTSNQLFVIYEISMI